MKRLTLAALAVASVSLFSCTDDPTAPGGSSSPAPNPSITRSTCLGCIVNATFSRDPGVPKWEGMSFAADPAADYVLDATVVAGGDYSVTVTVDDKVLGVLRDWPQLVNHIRVPVTLKANSHLSLRLSGRQGVRVAVQIIGGVKTVDASGGTVSVPGGGIQVQFPAGSLGGATEVSIAKSSAVFPDQNAQAAVGPYTVTLSGGTLTGPATVRLNGQISTLANPEVWVLRNGGWSYLSPSRQGPSYIDVQVSGFSTFICTSTVSLGPPAASVPLVLGTDLIAAVPAHGIMPFGAASSGFAGWVSPLNVSVPNHTITVDPVVRDFPCSGNCARLRGAGGEVLSVARYTYGVFNSLVRFDVARGTRYSFFLYGGDISNPIACRDEVTIEIDHTTAPTPVWRLLFTVFRIDHAPSPVNWTDCNSAPGPDRYLIKAETLVNFDPVASHILTIERQPTFVAARLDGNEVSRTTSHLPRSPMKVLLNVWAPSGDPEFPTPDPADAAIYEILGSWVGLPGTVEGVVSNTAGTKLQGVIVTASPGASAATDALGHYLIPTVPPGPVAVRVSGGLPPSCAPPPAQAGTVTSSATFFADFSVNCATQPGSGLVAFYPLDGNTIDAAGSFNATRFGGSFTTDRNGIASSALSLDGSTDSLRLPAAALGSFTSGAISFWLRLSGQTTQYYTFARASNTPCKTFGNPNSYPTCTYPMRAQFGSPSLGSPLDRFYFELNGEGPSYAFLPASTNPTSWHMYTFVWSGGQKQIYLDGVLLGSAAAAAASAAVGDIVFGAQATPRNEMLAGVIDDIRIFSGALTASQVAALYAPPSAPLAPSWAPLAAMPTARQAAAGVVLNSQFYVIGGYNGSVVTAVQAYNPATDSWVTKTPTPSDRYAGNGAGSIGNRIYMAGGFSAFQIPQSTLFIYDAGTDSWTTGADAPVAGGCGGSGVIGQLLYVVTGCPTSNTFTPFLSRYDPGSNSWTTLTAPPHQHEYPAMGVNGSKLYVVGGCTSISAFDIYDVSTGTWTSGPPMNAPRCAATGQVVSGKLYVYGGSVFPGAQPALSSVEVYDPASNAWTTLNPVPSGIPRWDAASGVIGGRIYVAGGTQTALTFFSTLEVLTP